MIVVNQGLMQLILHKVLQKHIMEKTNGSHQAPDIQ
jgi:hypothetical protein